MTDSRKTPGPVEVAGPPQLRPSASDAVAMDVHTKDGDCYEVWGALNFELTTMPDQSWVELVTRDNPEGPLKILVRTGDIARVIRPLTKEEIEQLFVVVVPAAE